MAKTQPIAAQLSYTKPPNFITREGHRILLFRFVRGKLAPFACTAGAWALGADHPVLCAAWSAMGPTTGGVELHGFLAWLKAGRGTHYLK